MIALADIMARIKTTDPSIEALVERNRLGTIALFETKTNRLWNRRVDHVFRDEVDGIAKRTDSSALWVPLYPIETITGTEFYLSDGEAAAEAIDAEDLIVDLQNGNVRRAVNRWRDVVTWTITGGYTTTTCPADIREALILQTIFTFQRNAIDKVAVRSLGFEGGQTAFMDPNLHPTFADAIQVNFRRAH